ncbi:small multidrug efflux protein [Arthrobacter gandavensis]|uniref:small multidrug efflux protein n=1 Tax=Arthrobacter gandavensis TaxID=169960 RepID=UPI00188FBD5A|nr:small multidrug efflux protein [Arthrobacter gandavensis]MBF4994823.1 small multidrug efflux protein [Arthrobacter gandavensis]
MNPTQELVHNFQELLGQVPEFIQPFILLLAAAVPFLEGEVGAMLGVVGGLNPVLAATTAAVGNFASVALVVLLTSRARAAVTNRVDARAEAAAAAAGGTSTSTLVAVPTAKPESKGRRRFKRWLVRFGVPGASIMGPLAIPTHFTASILVAGGTPRGWVLLWQGVAIVIWTTISTVLAWGALRFVVGA